MAGNYATNLGYNKNYYARLTVTNTTFGTTGDGYIYDAIWTFNLGGLILVNSTAAAANKIIEYSFNGNTVDGILDCNNVNLAKIQYSNFDSTKLWVRVQAGSTGPLLCDVFAWAHP